MSVKEEVKGFGLLEPKDVMSFATQRGLSPLVYVEWRPERKRIGQTAGWEVFGPNDGYKFFQVSRPHNKSGMLAVAQTWAYQRYGVREWARLQGMPGVYFPKTITDVVRHALRSTRTGGEDSTRRGRQRDESALRHQILLALASLCEEGITWAEASELFDCHHGVSSGQLSVLHEDGRLARLVERRNGKHIYVLPAYVKDRPTQPYGIEKNRLTEAESAALSRIKIDLTRGIRSTPLDVRLLVEAVERITS
jgi:hypothetical protein